MIIRTTTPTACLNRLPRRVCVSAKNAIDGRMRFKLPDDARQGRPVVMNLRLLHPTLPAGIIKELKDCVKRLIWIVHNIGKPSALIVFEERIACNCHTWQTWTPAYQCHCN
jgi:hypothetical protein